MFLKKIPIFGLLFILTPVFMCAEDVPQCNCNWFTNKRNWSITLIEDSTNYLNFTQFKLGAGVTGSLDMTELTVDTGLFFENSKIHETYRVSYAPTLFNRLNPGILLQNHFCWDIKDYFECDFLAGSFVKYKVTDFFILNCAVLFQQKLSCIYNLPASKRLVYSCCPAFDFDFYFYPLKWMSVDLSLSSYSFYRYYLFLSPDVRLALNFLANKNLSLQVAGEIQAVDFFTMSANFNKLAFSFGETWRF